MTRGQGFSVRHARGFTLIEALIAIVVLATVAPVAMAAITAALHGAAQAQRQDVAQRVAHARLAQIVSDGSWQGSATGGACDPTIDGSDAVELSWRITVEPWHDPTVRRLHLSVFANAAASGNADGSDGQALVELETLVVPPVPDEPAL